MRHRAAELGERCEFLQVETYGEGLDRLDQRVRDELEVIDPTSYAARRFVRKRGMHVLPSRGLGDDGPRRFAVTATEAEAALDDFIGSRLNTGDCTMAHSLLSVPLNLGRLDPRAVVERVAAEDTAGRVPLASVEGYVIASSNYLGAQHPLPRGLQGIGCRGELRVAESER